MFDSNLSRKTQRVISVLFAVVIVAAGASVWAYGAAHAAHSGYSVTITQLQ